MGDGEAAHRVASRGAGVEAVLLGNTVAVAVDGASLGIAELVRVARRGAHAELAPACVERMVAARALVDAAVSANDVVYGINTGFGDLSTVTIHPESLRQLQRNLVLSHATGVGPPLPEDVVRAMMLLRVNSLAAGHSGARIETARALLAMFRAGVHPVVPSQGSVGASGDLAPLAHIALGLIGEGMVTRGGEALPAREALASAGLGPLELEAKEGLALINGTQAMTAIGALAVHDARTLILAAEAAAALSTEALRGTNSHLDARIHDVRPHPGQRRSAQHMRALLPESEILASHRYDDPRVQDAYTLRCVPPVLGAVRDAVEYAAGVIEIEMNAVTDNPLLFPDDGAILNGGNFHGQPVALALDVLALALTQLGNFSERRVFRLTDARQSGLPAFLATRPGLDSGMMAVQYTAAALASENKGHAHPASADSIPTSGGQEDFVSMGMGGALKLRRVVENARHIVAAELLCATEGLEYLRPLRASEPVEALHAAVRQTSPALDGDRSLSDELSVLAERIAAGDFSRW